MPICEFFCSQANNRKKKEKITEVMALTSPKSSRAVAANTTLTDLRVEGNKIQLLPSEMHVMTWIKSLHLRDNGTLFSLPKFPSLDLLFCQQLHLLASHSSLEGLWCAVL